MALQGTIKDFGLADILQLIGIQRKSGVLAIGNGIEKVTVKFLEGQVVGADTERRSVEDLLGAVLVKTGRITEAQLQSTLRIQKNTLQRLGHILVKKDLISEEDLIEALRVQTLQIVYRLFRWREGDYSFQTVDDLEYDERHFTPISAETILMEGARMVDEWPIIERRIRSDQMVLRRTEAGQEIGSEVQSMVDEDIEIDLGFQGDEPPEKTEEPEGIRLSSEEREVLHLVDGKRTAEEISERTTLGEFDTYRILADLLTRSLIEEVRRPTATEAAAQSRGIVDRMLQGTLNAVILLAVLAALATLNANPLSPWRVSGGNDGDEQLRFYASQARLESIERAIQVFYLDAGVMPISLDLLAHNGYLRTEDLADPWGRPYGYSLSPGGYQLFAVDETGAPDPARTVSHQYSSVQRIMLDAGPNDAPAAH